MGGVRALGNLSPRFVSGKAGKRFARKFKRTIHLVDSSTIPLIASCVDWAKHRRRKAAAKSHVRPDPQSFLPRFAMVDTARHTMRSERGSYARGSKQAKSSYLTRLTSIISHLADLSRREMFWVTRAKENMSYRVERQYQKGPVGKIVRDDLVREDVGIEIKIQPGKPFS